MSISELKTVALSQSVRKFDAAFEYLDTNGDSHVSTDELFEVFGKKKAKGRKKSGKRRREPSLHMPVHWMDSSLALGETLERLRLDFNGDGRVDGIDVGGFLGAWNSSDRRYDLDGNGTVGPGDLGLLLGAWGSCG